ncbi:MAG: orotidine-5'-phosphate decarboxylase [Candidatus Krumholzibacteriia bacterium]
MDRRDLVAALRETPRRRRVITALDVAGGSLAAGLAGRLGDDGLFVKVGLELFSAAGPEIVRDLRAAGREVFLDLKYHDIPNTVAGAARQAAALGVAFTTVHASAGRRAVAAAAAALAEGPPAAGASGGPKEGGRRPVLLAVTVLTSLDDGDVAELAPGAGGAQDQVVRLARIAWESGCDGLVCSPADLERLRDALGPEPLVVTPGVRPAGAQADDQRRVATPAAAMARGADFLVVGRPVTQADDPVAALAAIARELESA